MNEVIEFLSLVPVWVFIVCVLAFCIFVLAYMNFRLARDAAHFHDTAARAIELGQLNAAIAANLLGPDRIEWNWPTPPFVRDANIGRSG